MDLNNLSFFKAVTSRMHWLADRQKVLAENVANADTPGYQAKDLTQPNFGALLRQTREPSAVAGAMPGQLRVTHSAHIVNPSGATPILSGVRSDPSETEASPNENSVVLEEEMMKVTKTNGDYTMMTNVYAKGVKLMRLAISRG